MKTAITKEESSFAFVITGSDFKNKVLLRVRLVPKEGGDKKWGRTVSGYRSIAYNLNNPPPCREDNDQSLMGEKALFPPKDLVIG